MSKNPQTIKQHLLGNVTTGDEKKKQRIFSDKEEKSQARYLLNTNRACECLTEKQGVVLNILRVRQQHQQKKGS